MLSAWESGWWVRCLFSVYNKTWRNRFPPCAQCGLENKVRYCPMISIHLQNLCCNSAWMVISRFVQITYSFTVETTCSCKKMFLHSAALKQAWWCRISSGLWAKGLKKWNHSFDSVSKLSAKCEKLQSWILMLAVCVWEKNKILLRTGVSHSATVTQNGRYIPREYIR